MIGFDDDTLRGIRRPRCDLAPDNGNRRSMSFGSSKRITGILWNFARICALLDFTCSGFLDMIDYLEDNRFKT